ncbi:MAG: GDP-L-fucose synthase [Pseudomonadota bacterium]|nr:GDP-L-fucose synthase [Pseudomonadota bacterium]
MSAVSPDASIFVAGHRGLVGSAIARTLASRGHSGIVTRTRAELDLLDPSAVRAFFDTERPEYVVLAAARVGGIHANDTYPASFIYENLMIEANVIDSAWRSGVNRLLLLGSSCIYPRLAAQPMREDALLTGTLEPTNEPYAIAKIAGIKLCESYNRQYGTDFRSVMPTNLYGPHDNFDLNNSHVIPALIRKFHEARENGRNTVEVWGTGRARREFLHVDDMASACLYVLALSREDYAAQTRPMLSHINIGTREDIAIADLARMVAEVTGYDGKIVFDTTKPDGAPRKLLDVRRLSALGWKPKIGLREGLDQTYRWFLENSEQADSIRL